MPESHRFSSTAGARLGASLAVLFTLLSLVAAGSAEAKDPSGSAGAADVKIVSGWIEAPLWDGDEPPVYFTIMNKGAETLKLVGASSTSCERMELRRAAMVNGTMASEPIDSFDIPGGGGAVAFVPRGLFLRMIKPSPMEDGDKLQIEISFDNGQTASFEAVVKDE